MTSDTKKPYNEEHLCAGLMANNTKAYEIQSTIPVEIQKLINLYEPDIYISAPKKTGIRQQQSPVIKLVLLNVSSVVNKKFSKSEETSEFI